MTADPTGIEHELRQGAIRLTRAALEAQTLPNRLFLESYGRLVHQYREFVEYQRKAGILSEEDITRLVEFPLEIARSLSVSA